MSVPFSQDTSLSVLDSQIDPCLPVAILAGIRVYRHPIIPKVRERHEDCESDLKQQMLTLNKLVIQAITISPGAAALSLSCITNCFCPHQAPSARQSKREEENIALVHAYPQSLPSRTNIAVDQTHTQVISYKKAMRPKMAARPAGIATPAALESCVGVAVEAEPVRVPDVVLSLSVGAPVVEEAAVVVAVIMEPVEVADMAAVLEG